MLSAEVSRIITEAMKKAEQILIKHRAALDAIAAKPVEVETIEREEWYEKLVVAHGILPKKKQDIEHQV